jgi:hypothetical protein
MDLGEVDLFASSMKQANLINANLYHADLVWADLSFANLHNANLTWTHLSKTDLRNTNFAGAMLYFAEIVSANMEETNLSNAKFGWTKLGNLDLRTTVGLDHIEHLGPSTLGIDTIYRSKGDIPAAFLRGVGISEDFIRFIQNELKYQKAQINPLFISYNHKDSGFVDRIEELLQEKEIRFWRDVHDAMAGRLETQVDFAMRQNPIVLLILSKNSVESDWVQHEARLARKLELEKERDVLCPIALDDHWKTCNWPERLREQIMEYNILDFSDWRNETAFESMASKLLDGLNLFYKNEK